jgi:hypothetical protein
MLSQVLFERGCWFDICHMTGDAWWLLASHTKDHVSWRVVQISERGKERKREVMYTQRGDSSFLLPLGERWTRNWLIDIIIIDSSCQIAISLFSSFPSLFLSLISLSHSNISPDISLSFDIEMLLQVLFERSCWFDIFPLTGDAWWLPASHT